MFLNKKAVFWQKKPVFFYEKQEKTLAIYGHSFYTKNRVGQSGLKYTRNGAKWRRRER
jgi:hypothetical protein